MAKRYTEPFINKFGHKIEVGDKVVVVAQGYQHSIRTYEGFYIGFTETDYYGRVVQHAQVRTFDNGWCGDAKTSRIATLNSNLIFPSPKEVQYANL